MFRLEFKDRHVSKVNFKEKSIHPSVPGEQESQLFARRASKSRSL